MGSEISGHGRGGGLR